MSCELDKNILPQSMQEPHIMAFDILMRQRLENIGLDSLLVYIIDTVNEETLYQLARQFDLLGFNGWKLADTTQKKRALVKKGIELHRYKGTVWSVKEALKTVGYPDVSITEHVGHWAGFTIELNAGNQPISEEIIREVTGVVNAYKNARSHLMGFEFKIEFSAELKMHEESYEASGDLLEESIFLGSDFKYNGEYRYDGTKNYNSDEDLLELTIKTIN